MKSNVTQEARRVAGCLATASASEAVRKTPIWHVKLLQGFLCDDRIFLDRSRTPPHPLPVMRRQLACVHASHVQNFPWGALASPAWPRPLYRAYYGDFSASRQHVQVELGV